MKTKSERSSDSDAQKCAAAHCHCVCRDREYCSKRCESACDGQEICRCEHSLCAGKECYSPEESAKVVK